VLTTLTNRGYLVRSGNDKTYKLGLSLIAVGHGAEKSQPIAVRAMEAADRLCTELGVGALLTTAVGEEILAVYALEGPTGRNPGMHDGERLPLVAPFGAPFLAWASEAEMDAWLARGTKPEDPAIAGRILRDIAIIKKRGYQMHFTTGGTNSFGALISEMAASESVADYKSKISSLANAFHYHMEQPEDIDEEASYEVTLIAAPIFDRDGNAVFNLGVGGFTGPLSGKAINRYAERLLVACLEVMRSERTSGRKREHGPAS